MPTKFPKNLSPSEFLQLQKNSLDAYNDAVWMLADILKLGKEKFGRKRLMELTPLSLTKVQWFVGIASLEKRNLKLTPEHHAEVIGHPKASMWLAYAKEGGLKPLELRAAIRKADASFKKEKKFKSGREYPKYVDVILRELKNLPADEQAKAKAYVQAKLMA